MKSNPLFWGDNLIPFEIILKQNNVTLFEQEVTKRLETPIEEDGYKFQDAHIKLGSKIHLKDFYYAERLFQNSYYAIRFAYLISKCLFHKLKESSSEITVLGYGLYSELLVSNTARFLNRMFGTDKFNHCIVEDVEELSILNLNNLKKDVILIIPIGSTLTTQIKIYRKLKSLKNGRGGYQYDSPPNMVLNPICVLVVGHGKIEKICSNNGEIIDPVVKKFWKKVDTTRKEISLANIPSEFKNKNIKKTHYVLYLPSEWNLPHECKYCWNEKKSLFYTDKVSVSPKTIFESPKAKENDNLSFAVTFESTGVGNRKAIIMPDMVKYGHYKRGMNHYLFYIDTNRFFAKNKEAIGNWLDSVKDDLKKKTPDFEEKPCLLIAPSHEANIDFVNLVNEKIFKDAAYVIYSNPFLEGRQNLTLFFEKFINKEKERLKEPLIFFADDALCTGRTFYYVETFLKSLGRDFNAAFVMLNRLSHERNASLRSKKIHAFCQLEAPVVVAIGGRCYLCREKRRYQEILKYTTIDALREGIRDKIKKLEPKDIIKLSSESDIVEEESLHRHLTRLEVTHKLYHKFSQIGDSDFKIKKDVIDKIVGKKIHQEEYRINLIKTLSQPPFIYHRKIREKVYPFLLQELNETLSKITNRPELIHYAIILIKRLAYLGSPELLKREFLENVKTIFKNSHFEIEAKNVSISQKWSELKNKISFFLSQRGNCQKPDRPSLFPSEKERKIIEEVEIFCKEFHIKRPNGNIVDIEKEVDKEVEKRVKEKINKSKKEAINFNLIYGLAVKEVLVSDEAKAFRLERELDSLLKGLRSHENKNEDFYDLLRLLYVENNIIIKNAINILTEALREKIDRNETLREIFQKIKNIPFEDRVKEIIKVDYRLSYLRYLINYKINKNENSDILNDDFYKKEFYQNTFAPLLSLNLFLNRIAQNGIGEDSLISDLTKYILKYLLKVANITEGNGGVFLAIKKGFNISEKVSELYIIGKLGRSSEKLDEHLADRYSWTIEVFNGVRTRGRRKAWTNVERFEGDNESRYEPKIRFENLYEYKKLNFKHFLFLRITDLKDERLDPKGVLVFYKEEPFSFEEQRDLLLLKDSLCEFLVKHYENYSFQQWISNKENFYIIKRNIEKFRHGEAKYPQALMDILNILDTCLNNCPKSLDLVNALRIQAKIIKSKWTIGHYFAIENVQKQENIRNEIQGKTLHTEFFPEFKSFLETIKKISKCKIGQYLWPNISNFDYKISEELIEKSLSPTFRT